MNKEIVSRNQLKCAVVIIGNGFDLAHKAETSFLHFANNHFIPFIANNIRAYYDGTYDDTLISSLFNDNFLSDIDQIMRGNSFIINGEYMKLYSAIRVNKQHIIENLLKDRNFSFSRCIKNKFLYSLLNDRDINWFNIENEYFNFLFYLVNSSNKKYDGVSIKELNYGLLLLKKEFINYLNSIDIKLTEEIEKFLVDQLKDYNDIIAINFNYTNTFQNYLDMLYPIVLNEKYFEIVNIHGAINDNSEKIVFGYGNDQDDEYKQLKKNGENSYLINMKTVNYLMDNKYSKFLEMMGRIDENSSFDVIVLGHSLGLTDKTLLQEVFDNKKCDRIKLFKRKFDFDQNDLKSRSDYMEKVIAITRVMKFENEARKKVSNFEDSIFFP